MPESRPGDAAASGPSQGGGSPPQRTGGPDPSAGMAAGAAPDALSPAAAPRPSSRCAWQTVEGEAVILDLEGRRVMGLNPVGSLVWNLLDGKRTAAEIAAAVADRFQIANHRAAEDVGVFLGALLARGLIEI
jgi:hypothetical protein